MLSWLWRKAEAKIMFKPKFKIKFLEEFWPVWKPTLDVNTFIQTPNHNQVFYWQPQQRQKDNEQKIIHKMRGKLMGETNKKTKRKKT